jgi:hypothetical protein
VQISGVDDERVGVTLEVAVGAIVKSAAVETCAAMAGKVIVFAFRTAFETLAVHRSEKAKVFE